MGLAGDMDSLVEIFSLSPLDDVVEDGKECSRTNEELFGEGERALGETINKELDEVLLPLGLLNNSGKSLGFLF